MNESVMDEQQLMSYVRHQALKPASDLLVLVDRGSDYLDGLLEQVSDSQARICPEPGGWCICEVLIHVISATHGTARLVESLSAGVKPDVKLSAPTVEMGSETLAELRQGLAESFEHMRSVVRALPEGAGSSVTLFHPLHGELTAKEWAVLGYLHVRDHGMQIEKVKAAPDFPA
jgi:hypothetical protein